MKKFLALAAILAAATACSTFRPQQFSMTVDPPDAEIRVIPGGGEPERTYRSPATITLNVPRDRAEAAKGRIEIKRATYKTRIIGLDMIGGNTLKIKLDKLFQYRLKYRLIAPVVTDELGFRDKILSIMIIPGERQFELDFRNYTEKPLTILWDRAEYTDYMNGRHPLMPAGVKPENRNDIMPPQVVPARGTVHEFFFPKTSVVYSSATREYTTKLLLPIDSEAAPALKGRTINVFLPLEMDRAIIPDYNLKFQIVDVIKEEANP